MLRSRCLRLVAVAFVMSALGALGLCRAENLPPRALVVYHDSWNDFPAPSPALSSLAALPSYLNVVNLAFARPDLVYVGDLDLAMTGLEYRFTGQVLRDSIDLLKKRHPGTRVLLSVGGSGYCNWDAFNAPAVARLVRDLHADGMAIDFELRRANCTILPGGRTTCATDAVWANLVRRIREVLPRPMLLTASVWSVGAYGEGAFRAARPVSQYTGLMLSLLRSPLAGELDLLSINAYDAGPEYDPLEAFRAYRAVWPGPLALGVEVQWKGGAGPFVGAAQAQALAREVAKDRNGAMMLYPLLSLPEGVGSADRPDGRTLATALCRGLELAGCDAEAP